MLDKVSTPAIFEGSLPAPGKLTCRQMAMGDAPAVVDMLTRGFRSRSRAYWVNAIAVLSARTVPEGFPRYGFVLKTDERIVGVILLIFSLPPGAREPRCHVSSWYVEPAFRAYASWLISFALKKKQAVYVNMSSAAHTRQTIVTQGFTCFARGTFLGLGFLAPAARDVTIREIAADTIAHDEVHRLLADHAGSGCISLVCDQGGQSHPFVFLRRRIPRTLLPCAQLIYCDDVGDFARFAGSIGRFMLKRGVIVFMLDANDALAGVPGVFLNGRAPKFFRGPSRPRLGDLAYSEAALFGP